ncbi:MAG: TIM barrel protein [Bryobacterales bacterium]|nr:TIM barrel protein [Bryobacterales bacterium]
MTQLKALKGPAVDCGPVVGIGTPFHELGAVLDFCGMNGFKGIQMPAEETRLMDVAKAAESQEYCDELAGQLKTREMVWSGMSAPDAGEALGAHRVYHPLLRSAEGAQARLRMAIGASKRLGIGTLVTVSGPLLWPFAHARRELEAGLVEDSFRELARRWLPVLDACHDAGVQLCFLPRSGQDVHDGASFERFLSAVSNHPAAGIAYHPAHLLVQQVDYLEFINVYAERIGVFLMADAEFLPNGRSGAHGGFQPAVARAPRMRSPGDGSMDFAGMFSLLMSCGYGGWVTLDYACVLKHAMVGIREGQQAIERNMILPQPGVEAAREEAGDPARNRRLLGLD